METQTRATGDAPGAAPASNPTATPIGPAGTPRRPELAESTESSTAEMAGKAREQLRKGRRHLREELSRGEAFVREHPARSAWTALGIGFALAQLPLRHLAAGLLRLTLFLLRPVALLYGVMKLVEEIRSAPPRSENRPG